MKEYQFEGEKYIFTGKKWLDNHYIEVPISILTKLNRLLIEEIDFDNMTTEELYEYAIKLKDGENDTFAMALFEKLLNREDVEITRKILARMTSCYRHNNFPEKAIELGECYINSYGNLIKSPALYTSLAAAACDIEDYTQARVYANKAKSMSYKNSGIELINVYSRIKKFDGGKRK